jgi:hypothetical protein
MDMGSGDDGGVRDVDGALSKGRCSWRVKKYE